MVRIIGALPPGPPTRDVQDALVHAWLDAAADFDAITIRLGDGVHPPSPCLRT